MIIRIVNSFCRRHIVLRWTITTSMAVCVHEVNGGSRVGGPLAVPRIRTEMCMTVNPPGSGQNQEWRETTVRQCGRTVGQVAAAGYVAPLGGLDLTGKAAVLKTAARERFGVRIPGPPLLIHNDLRDPPTQEGFVFGHILGHIDQSNENRRHSTALRDSAWTQLCPEPHQPIRQ